MKRVIPAVVFCLAPLAIAGCGHEPTTEVLSETVSTVDIGIEGLSVSNARLVLPAVPGNPAGVFFDLSYTGADEISLETASVERASGAMIHDVVERDGMTQMVSLGSLALKSGDTVEFAPGGKHVMAMQLDGAVAAGDTIEIALGFAGGLTARFPATVEPAGGAAMEH